MDRLDAIDAKIQAVMRDPAAHYWLRSSLNAALRHDPVDMANDAEVLSALLKERCDALMGIAALPSATATEG